MRGWYSVMLMIVGSNFEMEEDDDGNETLSLDEEGHPIPRNEVVARKVLRLVRADNEDAAERKAIEMQQNAIEIMNSKEPTHEGEAIEWQFESVLSTFELRGELDDGQVVLEIETESESEIDEIRGFYNV